MPSSNPELITEPRPKKNAKNNWRQFYRYLLVGGSSFLLEYGLFYILLELHNVNYLIANSIVYSTVSAINFALNRLWTFRSTNNLSLQISLYLSLLMFNFIASNVLLYILTGQLLIPPLWSKFCVMVMVVLWNFVLYKKVIYR